MKKLIILSTILLIGLKINAQDGKYVETNGVKIYYEMYGEGDPLLLLHGFMSSHKQWEPWIKDLSKKHLLIIPDSRGHGNSSNPSNKFTHKLAAKDMYGLMDTLKIEKFKAIGNSSGSMILTHMATMDTTRITSMILISSTSFYPEESRAIQRQIFYEKENKNRIAFLETLHPGGEKQIRQLMIQFNNMAEDYDDMNFTAPYLSTIKSKTLIIHGDSDVFFPIDIPIISYKAIPNSYLWIIPNAGHMPFGFYERKSIWADVFLKVTEDFFEGKW
jgi:pimeloyl-ACP methyl ester carboxylesterase